MTQRRIRIVAGYVSSEGSLNDTSTAVKIWDALPIESDAQRWGAEIYFQVPVIAPDEDAQARVESGTLAYWPVGHCFCIFFGQTPASPVNVVGMQSGDADVWDAVAEGASIRIERVD